MADMGDESVPEVAEPTVVSPSAEDDPSITTEDSDPKQSAEAQHIEVEEVDKEAEECQAIAAEIPTSTSESNSNESLNLHEIEETKEEEEVPIEEPEVHIKCIESLIEVDMSGTEELLSSNASNQNEGAEEKPDKVISVYNNESTLEDTVNIQEETLETNEKENDESTNTSALVEGIISEGLREKDTCEKNEIDESSVESSKSEGHVNVDVAQAIVETGNNVDDIYMDNSMEISMLNPIEKDTGLISLEKENDPIIIEAIIAVEHFVDTKEGTNGIGKELETQNCDPLGEDVEAKDLIVVELVEPKQEGPIAESISHDLIEEVDTPVSMNKENDHISIENKETTNTVGAELDVRNYESLGGDIKCENLPIVELSEIQQEVEEKYIDHLTEDIDEPILYEEVVISEPTTSCEESIEANNVNEPQIEDDEYDKSVGQNELHQSKETKILVDIEVKETVVHGEQVINNNNTTSCEVNVVVEEVIVEEEKFECSGECNGIEELTSAANENQYEVQETLLVENSKGLDYPDANEEFTISNKEVEDVQESVVGIDTATLQPNEEPSQNVNEVAHSLSEDHLLAVYTQEPSEDKECGDEKNGMISTKHVNQEDMHEIAKANCTISNEVQDITSFVVEAVTIEDPILIVHEAILQVRKKAQEDVSNIIQEESSEKDVTVNRDIDKIHKDLEDATDEAQIQCVILPEVPSREGNDLIIKDAKSIDKMENGSDVQVLPPIISPSSVEQTCEDNILVASAIVKDRVPEDSMKEEALETKMGVVIEKASIWPVTIEEALKRNWFRFLDVICLRAS